MMFDTFKGHPHKVGTYKGEVLEFLLFIETEDKYLYSMGGFMFTVDEDTFRDIESHSIETSMGTIRNGFPRKRTMDILSTVYETKEAKSDERD